MSRSVGEFRRSVKGRSGQHALEWGERLRGNFPMSAVYQPEPQNDNVSAVPETAPPITEDRAFWTIFAAALAVAVASPVVPDIVRSVDADWNVRFSYGLAAIWFALQTVAVIRHRWRGFWLLIGLPIVLYWPIAFKLLEYACRHDPNACL